MKKFISPVLFIVSALLFVAMFFVDGSAGFLDMTNMLIWSCCILSAICTISGFYFMPVKKYYMAFIREGLVILTFMSVNPAKDFHQRDTIEVPGTELSSPPQLYVMTDREKHLVACGGYEWHCGDEVTVNRIGFSGWMRIGFPDYAEFTEETITDETENIVLHFTDFPDEIEIRRWDNIDWDWPSDMGEKIELSDENSIEICKGYYRITGLWREYGSVEYGFIIK